MSFCTYILYSKSKDRYYIGSSADVDERLKRHNVGATPSTKPGRPWRIAYIEVHQSKTDAILRENYIKSMKSRKYIEKLISEGNSVG